MMIDLPPFLIFYIAALFVLGTNGRLRFAILLLAPLFGLINLLFLEGETVHTLSLFGEVLTITRLDRLSFLFGFLFHIAAFLGLIFSLHVKDRVQQVAGLLYVGSALGAVFAGDLLTLLVFWEILAFTSVFLILARGTARSYGASVRYLVFQVFSGVLLFSGTALYFYERGSFSFNEIGLVDLSSWLLLFAFGIKSAFPFFHNWLTDAYPEATPTGTVLLSSFTTKVGICLLARSYPGTELLIYIGVFMAMFPIFYAVIENDLRRVLSYSLINQLGFMICGIGIGTEMGINGAVAHAFNDVIFKGLLFMSMGAVLFRSGKMDGSALGGLYKSMPWTTGFCLVGAASISAFPLFSGFVSKSMVMVAVMEEHYFTVWLALLFASAGVFHHAGIKIPFFAFFAHDSGIRCKEAPRNMLLAMGLSSAICIFNGIYPYLLYSYLPYVVSYEPYTFAHVLTQLQLLFFSALAFCFLNLFSLYPPELPGVNLDFEWTYRKVIPLIAWRVLLLCRLIRRFFLEYSAFVFDEFVSALYRYHGPRGIVVHSWPTGVMVFGTILLLGSCLFVYFLNTVIN